MMSFRAIEGGVLGGRAAAEMRVTWLSDPQLLSDDLLFCHFFWRNVQPQSPRDSSVSLEQLVDDIAALTETSR